MSAKETLGGCLVWVVLFVLVAIFLAFGEAYLWESINEHDEKNPRRPKTEWEYEREMDECSFSWSTPQC